MILKKLKAIELVMDWNLWPRHEAQSLDSTNVKRMIEALEAGKKLPPVIVDADSLRIIDGFHRTKAHLQFYGNDAEIECIVKKYTNENDMFAESLETNSIHGLPLTPKDIVHAYHNAKRRKMPPAVFAACVGMDMKRLKILIEGRTAKGPDGENVALSRGAKSFAGKQLTTSDMKAVKSCNGGLPEMYVSMLINVLNADSYEPTEKMKEKLEELSEIIKRIIK